MANFDFEDFKKKAGETAETVAGKSVEFAKMAADKTVALAKIAKLYAEIAGEKEVVRKLNLNIGKKYYELHHNDAETELAQSVADIDAAYARIAAKRQAIDDLRNTEPDVEVEIEIEIDDDLDDDGACCCCSTEEETETEPETEGDTQE